MSYAYLFKYIIIGDTGKSKTFLYYKANHIASQHTDN